MLTYYSAERAGGLPDWMRFDVAAHAADVVLQRSFRPLESLVQSEMQVRFALVKRRPPADVHFAAIGQRQLDVDVERRAGPVMRRRRLDHDPTRGDPPKMTVEPDDLG